MQRYIFKLALLAFMVLTLPANAQTYVLDEGFEGNMFPPDGWSVIDADGDGHCWQQGGTGLTRGSGDKVAVSYTVDASTNTAYRAQNNYLVTPKIEVKNNSYTLSLSYIAEDVETDEHITVLVSTTGKKSTDFTDKLYDGTVSNLSYGEVKVNTLSRSLSAYDGKSIYVAILHTGTDTYALGIDDVRIINQKGPASVSSFKAVAHNGATPSALLTWTNPSVNGKGESLSSVGVNIYRDGSLLASLKDLKGGEAVQYEDTSVPSGNHSYAVAAVNEEGESKRRQTTLYVGEDIPGQVSDLTVTASNGVASLSWTAPASGKNKGWIDAANLKYDIMRFTASDTTLVAEKVAGTDYKVSLQDGVLTGFLVTAVNSVGPGEAVRSNTVVGYGPNFKDIAVGSDATVDYRHKRLPMDMYTAQSVSETVYYPADLRYATGSISYIIYKNHFRAGTETKCPVKVYIGETTQRSLANGWIPAKDLQLVYDDSLVLHENDNDVPVKLKTPYQYQGGNLVVMVVHGKPTRSGTYFDVFYVSSTADKDKRSRVYDLSGGENLDSLKTTFGTPVGEVPQTRFIITTDNMTSLSGRITDEHGHGIANAKLTVKFFNIEAVTDNDGNYSFDMLPSGPMTIAVSAIGYEDKTVSITLSGEAMTSDVYLTALAKATVSGAVAMSDDAATVSGAVVSLDGYAPFTTTTSADGSFSFDGVYAGKSYQMTVRYPDYDIYTCSVNPKGDLSLGTITLSRSLVSPFDVVATNNTEANKVVLTWAAPNKRRGRIQHTNIGKSGIHTDTSKDYSYTDYYVAHAWTAEDLRDSAMVGMSFKAVSAWLKAVDGSFSACVWKGDKNNHVLLAEKSIPLSAISAEGGWVTASLDEPVEIRDGEKYMVGIHVRNTSGEPVGVNYSSSATLSGRNNVKFSDEGYAYDGYYPYNISAYVGIPGTESVTDSMSSAPAPRYNVYRARKDGGLVTWKRLTALPIEQTAYTDESWNSIESGTYLYRVEAVYHDGTSDAAYSDTLYRSLDNDAGVSAFVSPVKANNVVSKTTVVVRIKNYGEKALTSVPVSCRLNDGAVITKTYDGSIAKGGEADMEIGEMELQPQAVSTLTAWTSLADDGDVSNDTLRENIPNYSDEVIGAFRWDAYGNSGVASFHANTPEAMTLTKEVTPDDALVSSGTVVEGGYLAFTATWNGSPRQLMLMDTTTWTPLRSTRTDGYFLDMTYDAATRKAYAISVGTDGTDLATIDLTTLSVSTIGSTGRDLHTLAFAGGKLYGIDSKGVLCTVDAATAKTTDVGATGVSDVRYLQSMTWLPKSHRMIWVQTGETSIGKLYQVNLSTGAATGLGQVVFDGYGSEMVGLYAVTEDMPTGIGMITTADGQNRSAVYSVSGVRRSSNAVRGLNIVRDVDGRTRKIVVR